MRTAAMSFGIALVTVLAAAPAEARPRVARSKRFESNKTLGLGLELGAIDGLTGKWFLKDNGDQAIDFGIGELYDGYIGNRDGLHIYADYLFHPYVLASTEAFELPLFIGAGVRFWDFNYGPNNGGDAIGIRVPFGLSFDFNTVPLDIFIAFVPVLDFIHDYTQNVAGDFDVSVGVRYWFE
jgi:hypothetical protein